MMDYKDRIQSRAEELAWELYEKDFYDLPSATRDAVYDVANKEVVENYYV